MILKLYSAKEIKSNCADIGRKVKKKIGLPPLPQRREKSPSYISHQPPKPTPNYVNSSSNSSLKLPNGFSNNTNSSTNNSNSNVVRKVANVNGITNGNASSQNGTGTSNSGSRNGVNNAVVGSGAQDITRRPLK